MTFVRCSPCRKEYESYSDLAEHLIVEHKKLATDYLVAFLISISEANGN